MSKLQLKITKHAYQRGKERLSWKRKTLERMADKAFFKGVNYPKTRGKLRRYVEELCENHGHKVSVKIYGENLYIFKHNVLITVYRVPNELIGILKCCK